jgi:hypothetical protein
MCDRLLFFAGGLFGRGGLIFLLVGAAGFCLFLRGFLLIRFWGFIAHDVHFLLRVHSPAAY